jgi:hypothetical protein
LHQNAVGQIAIRWTPNEMMNHGGEEQQQQPQQGNDPAGGEAGTSEGDPSPQSCSALTDNAGTGKCNSAPATADVIDSSDRM